MKQQFIIKDFELKYAIGQTNITSQKNGFFFEENRKNPLIYSREISHSRETMLLSLWCRLMRTEKDNKKFKKYGRMKKR